ncbi:unknown [Ruminococcus sp. CAG:379]|nr:unknown [Ruminococcus sp. CAG:379]
MSVWLFVGKQYYRLNVSRSGEQIHRLNLPGVVSQLVQQCAVPGGSGRITGDHHNALGCHAAHCLQSLGITALPGRIQHDHIRMLSTLGELLCPLGCIPHMKVGVFNAILPGIPDGIFHRLGDHLYPGQVLHPIRHGQADGTGATVQIQQRLAAVQLRKFPGNAIQPLRLGSVHLVKGMGGQLHPDAAHGIPDLRLPQQGFRPLTQNHVGACRIHIHANTGQLRKPVLQLLT